MPLRSWVALLLLINYLLVIGMGGMTQPQDQPNLLWVQTVEAGHYHQCQYQRMDSMAMLLEEALASRTPDAPLTDRHQLLSVVSGMDAHCLSPEAIYPPPTAQFMDAGAMPGYQLPRATTIACLVNAPPWTK